MPRHEYIHRPQCEEDGCTERAYYVLRTRREYDQTIQGLQRRGGWRCVRHTKADEVLSAENPVRETTLASYEASYGRFFAPEGQAKGGSGFVYGPGFKAFAKDFPPGTRLVVTARLEPALTEERET
jgi:hypothetical protein